MREAARRGLGLQGPGSWRVDALLLLVALLIALHLALLWARFSESNDEARFLADSSARGLPSPSEPEPGNSSSSSPRGQPAAATPVVEAAGGAAAGSLEAQAQSEAGGLPEQQGSPGPQAGGAALAPALGRAEEEAQEGASVDERACLLALLGEGEAVYRRHLERRGAFLVQRGRLASLEEPPGAPAPARRGFVRNVTEEGEIVTELLVPAYPCAREQRVGAWGEGGKWLCLAHLGLAAVPLGAAPAPVSAPVPAPAPAASAAAGAGVVVVSVGSRGKTEFESGVARLFHVTPYTLDPFLSRGIHEVVSRLPFLQYHKLGLTSSQEQAAWRQKHGRDHPLLLTVAQLLPRLGVARLDVLKADCEGCELGLAQDLAEHFPRAQLPVGVLAVEAHTLYNRTQSSELLRNLEHSGLRLFHAERNPHCHGCYELAFIHESLVLPPPPPPPASLAAPPPGSSRSSSSSSPGQQAGALTLEEDARCYVALAERAEAVHREQLALRSLNFGPSGSPNPRFLRWDLLIAIMLAPTYPCQLAERLGSWGKGGAWVCMRVRRPCPGAGGGREAAAVVTIGDRRNAAGSSHIRFEEEVAARLGGGAHVFNPFLTADARGAGGARAPHGEAEGAPGAFAAGPASQVVFHPVAVGGTAGKEGSPAHGHKVVSLNEMLSLVNTTAVHVLRIDCEGCEHALIADMALLYDASSVPFGQVALEIHNLVQDSGHIMLSLNALESLGFRLFHAEERESRLSFELSFVHASCC